jgi:hypothetical protein
MGDLPSRVDQHEANCHLSGQQGRSECLIGGVTPVSGNATAKIPGFTREEV